MKISRSVEVQAPADAVWALVSDLPNMGRLSPENAGGRWKSPATGPEVGARFAGKNQAGWRRWSTAVRVVRCVPGKEFAFQVSSIGLKVAEWAYDVAPSASGCTVTESWTDNRGALITFLGRVTTGVADREAYTATSIERTLAALKAVAEG